MKSQLNLLINSGVLREARAMGLPIRDLVEDMLRTLLNSFHNETMPENCIHKWTWPFATAMGLYKECLKCRSFKKVEIETYEETSKRMNA